MRGQAVDTFCVVRVHAFINMLVRKKAIGNLCANSKAVRGADIERKVSYIHTGPKYEATIATSTANMRITSSGLVNTRFTPVEAASWTASQRDTDELADDHFLLDVTATRVPGTIDFVALLLAPFFVFKVVEGLTMVLDFPCFGHAACELEVNQLYSCLLGAVHLELDLECLSASIYQCEGSPKEVSRQ